VNWSDADKGDEPDGSTTVTSQVPAPLGGEVTEIDVSEFTVKLAAGIPPKRTVVAVVNPVPVIPTPVPPPVPPDEGLKPVTVGTGAELYV
jgi:hypothetical protein